MKRILLISLICISALGVSAQGLKNVGKSLSKINRRSGLSGGSKAVKVPVVPVRPIVGAGGMGATTQGAALSQEISLQRSTASQVLSTEAPGMSGQALVPSFQPDFSPSVDGPAAYTPTTTGSSNVSALMRQINEELAENARQQQEADLLNFGGLDIGFGKSVLFAPIEAAGKTGGFSLTVFKTTYQGQEEVFGVIASHVLPESYYTFHSSLQRNFHVQIQQPDGSMVLFPAQVVQIAPRSMLDISLVKFPPEVQPLLHPLELADTPSEVNEILFSPGFAAGVPSKETRQVLKKSFLSVQTDQNLTGDRAGFCGSPLVGADGKIRAIHTGTKENKNASDISYGTHVTFINLLVQAYHNEGQAFYDLEINGHTLARLNVDEYISAIYLYDSTGKRLAQKNLEDKFSQTALTNMIKEYPRARYLQLTGRKAQWQTDNDGDAILKEDRSKNDKTKRQHWYNLQTRQPEPQRPAVIKQ